MRIEEIFQKKNKMYECEPICCDDPQPLIPDGIYQAQVLKWERGRYYNQTKLYLWFEIISPGRAFETKLFMVLNLNGNKVGYGSKYYRSWVIANHGIRPRRNDRLSPKIFLNKVFKVKVETVKRSYTGESVPEYLQYSVIREILDLEAGS
ncbi:MAG: hypothetical protein AB1410_01335 [Acidobacteriota bacterium]